MNRRRRAALALIAGAAFLPASRAARPPKRLAIVSFGQPKDWQASVDAFAGALGEHGFARERDVEIHLVGIEATTPEDAARQVREKALPLRPDVIVATGPAMAHLVTLAAPSVPFVTQVPDPVGSGYAKSLARPGGNVTGLSDNVDETAVKAIEVMKQLIPGVARVAILSEARPGAMRHAATFERAARSARLEPVMLPQNDRQARLDAIGTLAAKGIQAGFWSAIDVHPRMAADAALAARFPLFGSDAGWARFGGLAAYYGFEPNLERRLAAIAAQILRGTRPGEIPFQLPQHFRLELNRKTAAALGIKVSRELLLRADRVFE